MQYWKSFDDAIRIEITSISITTFFQYLMRSLPLGSIQTPLESYSNGNQVYDCPYHDPNFYVTSGKTQKMWNQIQQSNIDCSN